MGKTLIIGGSGMIGAALKNQLSGLQREPISIDLKDGIDICNMEWNSLALWWHTLQPDEVYHLAGMKGGVGIGRSKAFDFMNSNIGPMLTVLRLCKEVHMPRKLLYTSSIGVYQAAEEFFEEEGLMGEPHPSDYFGGYAKRVGEIGLEALCLQSGLRYLIVRPTNIFGIGDNTNPDTGMVVGATIGKLIRGDNPIVVWGDGSAQRDFLSATEVADGMVTVMSNGISGEAYNIGRGKAITIKMLVEAIVSLWNSRTGKNVKIEYSTGKPTGSTIRKMNNDKLRSLGWSPGNILLELDQVMQYYV